MADTYKCKACSDKYGVSIEFVVHNGAMREKFSTLERFLKKHECCGDSVEFTKWKKDIEDPKTKKAAKMVESLRRKGIPVADAIEMAKDFLNSA